MRQPLDPRYRRLIPVTKWNDLYDWPPIGGLRHLIFHAETNGFDAVTKRVGRRVLIDEKAFFEWVAAQNDARNDDESALVVSNS